MIKRKFWLLDLQGRGRSLDECGLGEERGGVTFRTPRALPMLPGQQIVSKLKVVISICCTISVRRVEEGMD